jgi:hypothetical protein
MGPQEETVLWDAPLAAAEHTGIYEDLGQRLTRG